MDRQIKATAPQALHAVAEGPNARQDQSIGGHNRIRIVGNRHGFTKTPEGGDHRTQVGYFAIDNNDHRISCLRSPAFSLPCASKAAYIASAISQSSGVSISCTK